MAIIKQGCELLDYTEARRRYPHLFPPTDGSGIHGGTRILSDPEEIQRASHELGVEPFMLIIPYGFLVLHLTRRPNGRYGSQHQMGSRGQLEGRGGVTAFPLWVDPAGVNRTCLVMHHRATLAWLPPQSGGGWELEVPSFGERSDGILRSISDEMHAEARLRVVGQPQRLDATDPAHPGGALFPGLSSHMEQVWLVPVEPLDEAVEEQEEGIRGRVLWTKAEFQEALRKGRVVIGGQVYLTTLAHNLVAAHWAELRGVW